VGRDLEMVVFCERLGRLAGQNCHGAIVAAGLHIDVNVLFYDRISRYGHFASIACAVDIS
jgi:hypothetical protein